MLLPYLSLLTVFLYIVLSIVIFATWRALQQRFNSFLLNPLLLSLFSIIALLKFFDISYTQYFDGARWLSFLVEPAVVILGYPLYLQLNSLRKYWPMLLFTSVLGSILAMTCAVVLGRMLGAEDLLLKSIASLCITTAISMEVAEQLGGSAALAALLVMIAGIGGSVLGLSWLKVCGIWHPIARGLAMGSASHALGTATIASESSVSAAYGSTALILTALLTALIAPHWVPVLLSTF